MYYLFVSKISLLIIAIIALNHLLFSFYMQIMLLNMLGFISRSVCVCICVWGRVLQILVQIMWEFHWVIYYTLFADIEPETKRSILADLKLLPLMLESSIFPLQFIHLILSKHHISLHFSFLCLFFVLLYMCLKLSIIIWRWFHAFAFSKMRWWSDK